MKVISMNKRRQAQLLGILFAEYQILTTEQASMIRNQMDRPSHVFDDSNSLWAFYNYVTIALQHSHPKTWMEDQRVLHYFISSVNNFSTPVPAPQVQTVVEAVVDPLTTNYGQPENQLNILTEIERTEAEETSLELEPNLDLSDYNNALVIDTPNLDELTNEAEESELEVEVEETYDRNIAIDDVITYTDPVGNTFEVPLVPPCAAHDSEPGDEDWMTLPTEDDDIEEWTGLDVTIMTLEPTPEEHVLFEADLSKLETEEEDDFDLLQSIEDEEDGDVPDFF